MKSVLRAAFQAKHSGCITAPRTFRSFEARRTQWVTQHTFHNISRYHIEGRSAQKSLDNASHKDSNQGQHDGDDVQGLKQKQTETPWHREGSDVPPAHRPRSAGAMVKGKLLSTPSRLLKLTLPLTTSDHNSDRKDIEPLALLVHPHQPLSYLERLIQSELPTFRDHKGNEKIPYVYFRAEDPQQDENQVQEAEGNDNKVEHPNLSEADREEKTEKTGVIKNDSVSEPESDESTKAARDPSSKEQDTQDHKFIRWSSSTEIGDFIRDAANGKEFTVEIEGYKDDIPVSVPSFNDRTHYLRQRLRRISHKISAMAAVKNECDREAHRAGQRIAMGGFASLVSWWGLVYYLTFKTDLGWDVMEPVTYLVGLSGLMGGYLFFLYHNREVSYRSALNMTISARQVKLYKDKGFDHEKWQNLVHEGNELRREVKIVADEYDVDWNEQNDVSDRAVSQALRKDREKKRSQKDRDDEGKEEEEEEDEDGESAENDETKKVKHTS